MSESPLAVLDASAVLAVVNEEAGASAVEEVMGNAAISAINLCEVESKLFDNGLSLDDLAEVVDSLQLAIVPFDRAHAHNTARLRRDVPRNFSLGERACLALAREMNLPAMTAEREWAKVKLPGIAIHCIR